MAVNGAASRVPVVPPPRRKILPPPGRSKSRREHQFALHLQLAMREAGKTTASLADKLNCSPRTVRRYLRGERRPDRGTVVNWEKECGVPVGRLTAEYDRLDLPGSDEPGDVAPEAGERPELPGGTKGGGETIQARRGTAEGSRRVQLMLGLIAAAVLAAVIVIVLIGGTGSSSTKRGSPQPDWDHNDPIESGCTTTAVGLALVAVQDRGQRLGTLELRGSTGCHAAWGRFVLTEPQGRPITITVVRPSDRTHDTFTYNKRPTPVYGNMLNDDHGCVYAEVSIGQHRAQTRTPCRH